MSSSIAFFSHPKPWISPFKEIQTAAVKSWQQLSDTVTLLGDDEGTPDKAKQLGTQFYPNIRKNEWGTPLVSDIFQHIQSSSHSDVMCYINTDIVLGDDFKSTVSAIVRDKTLGEQWLAIGCRTDLDLDTSFISETNIHLEGRKRGVSHGPSGIDYFIFPRGLFSFVYPFALGKFVWDQWLVGNVHRRGIPVIDCSKTIFAVHLNAPWFFRGGVEKRRETIEESEEAKRNRGFDYYKRTIADGATHFTESESSTYFVKSLKSI